MKSITALIFTLLIGCSFINHTALADWAYPFVVRDGYTYIITDTPINDNQIGPKIGKVTYYSDREGTYSGNFSNRYPKGTEYYKINDVDIQEAIAIKDGQGTFIKATIRGKYAGGKSSWTVLLPYFSGGLLLIVIAVLVKKRTVVAP